MGRTTRRRRGFLWCLAAFLVGMAVLQAASQPAQAARFRRGGYYGYRGYGYGRVVPRARVWGYPGGYYRGYGYGPRYYNRGYFGAPVVPYGIPRAPIYGGMYPPMM
jgi:hypothetical protein